jgi:hypothetical protein
MPSRSDGPFSIDRKRIVNLSLRIFVLVSVVVILVFAAFRSRHGIRGPDYARLTASRPNGLHGEPKRYASTVTTAMLSAPLTHGRGMPAG